MAKPNAFGDVCEKLLFDGSKISMSVLGRIPKGTFIPSLVPIGLVVSEEKSFEKLLMRTTTPSDGHSWRSEVIIKKFCHKTNRTDIHK